MCGSIPPTSRCRGFTLPPPRQNSCRYVDVDPPDGKNGGKKKKLGARLLGLVPGRHGGRGSGGDGGQDGGGGGGGGGDEKVALGEAAAFGRERGGDYVPVRATDSPFAAGGGDGGSVGRGGGGGGSGGGGGDGSFLSTEGAAR